MVDKHFMSVDCLQSLLVDGELVINKRSLCKRYLIGSIFRDLLYDSSSYVLHVDQVDSGKWVVRDCEVDVSLALTVRDLKQIEGYDFSKEKLREVYKRDVLVNINRKVG